MPQLQGFFFNNHEICFKKERGNKLKQESFKVNMCNKYTQCHLKTISDLCKAEKQL